MQKIKNIPVLQKLNIFFFEVLRFPNRALDRKPMNPQ